MANLRAISVNAADSRTIKASFTHDLSLSLDVGNVVVTSKESAAPDPEVLSVRVNGPIIIVTTRPLTPYARYSITFQSTNTVRFADISGSNYLFEDGRTNVIDFLGSDDPKNEIRDSFITYLKDQIYDEGLARGRIIRLVLDNIARNMLKARYNIYQLKNDNYLSFQVTNERKTRGYGPWDRLNEEGAYEVLRVSKNEENSIIDREQDFEEFPSDPVALQSVTITNENLTAANSGTGTFNNFTLTVAKGPVTILKNVQIIYAAGGTYDYDISVYGYKIKNPRYDTTFASTLVTLEDNQFQLNTLLLEDPSFEVPVVGDTIRVTYEYKNLGLTVENDSIQVTTVLNAVREPVAPILTQFTLEHAPIVNAGGVVPTSGGVQFLDPSSSTPFRNTHPAFVTEVPYSLNGLPRSPGEYAIDYETGRVVVYGEEDNDGTGNFPPSATYYYEKSFTEGLDYFYSSDFIEIVSSPIRDLRGAAGTLSYQVQQNLTPNIDYEANTHAESINERIQNRLLSTNTLETLNGPITNVFRIYNETSGEVYSISRWTDSKIIFDSIVPPRVSDKERERPSFALVTNEILLIENELVNILGTRIFKIQLENEKIISSTEDVIGSSYNSSAVFSRNDVFETEVYYDGQILSETANINRLIAGQYQINYRTGTIYVGVSPSQDIDIGTVSYRKPSIAPNNSHVLAVEEVYYSLNSAAGKTKLLNYDSFDEGEIIPSSFDVSDERFLNGDTTTPYLLTSGTITVTDDIKSVRHLYDVDDLNDNAEPTDFAEVVTWSANIITVNGGVQKIYTSITIGAGLTVTVPTISNGIVLYDVDSVYRQSDNQEFIDGYETIVDNTITLSGLNGESPGDVVTVVCSVTLDGAATPVVDYNRGDYFIDYTYLADEVLVSYEYGDNVIDFRQYEGINPGDTYFVSYKAGALRDALLNNFGSLVAIPEVQVFDVDLNRERYRDALMGALQTFTKGPTVGAIKQLVSSVTKIDPEITESVFEVWSLGISHLYRQQFIDNENPTLVSGKFDQGISINQQNQSVSFPVSSNLRLEEGSLEMWVIPEWDGLANDATITFSNLTRNGIALNVGNVYIGSSSYNPSSITFSLNRNDSVSPEGLPSAIHTQEGLFIYFDSDVSKWKVIAKARPSDGYSYTGRISSSGGVYDAGSIPGLIESASDIIRTTESAIDFTMNVDGYDALSPDGYTTGDGYIAGYSFDGIQFMADDEHYLFDFAEDENKNRFSLYKDGRGYLVFKVWDKGNSVTNRFNSYMVSADVRDWSAGEKHHVAISWALNTSEKRDEMHLFIDGFEQPNIIKYGGIPEAASTQRFRTVSYEIIDGYVTANAYAGNDLTTTQGVTTVTSDSLNFELLGVTTADVIEIREQGFSTTPYGITLVSGNSLVLDTAMPASLSDARFSINPVSIPVDTNIDLYANIAVYSLNLGVETEIPGLRADIPGYAIETTGTQRILKILGDVDAGASIVVRTLGLNHRRCRDKVYLWSDSAIVRTAMPPPIDLDDVVIKPIPVPYSPIGPNATDGYAIDTGDGYYHAIFTPTQVSNTYEGRLVDVRVTGGNVNFSTPTAVIIDGYYNAGTYPPVPTAGTETILFTAAGTKTSARKWIQLDNVFVNTVPINNAINGLAVEVKETYSAIIQNGNITYPVIRFAFQRQSGTTLSADGSTIVTDTEGFFSASDVGNTLIITGATDGYEILEKISDTSIRIDTAVGPFVNTAYKILDVSIGRSGFQNGFFYMEEAGTTDAWEMPAGFIELDYASYLEVPFDPIDQTAYIGNSYDGAKPADAVIDEFRILSTMLTDVRTGESISSGEKSFTISYQALNPFTKDSDTLVLLHFEELPLTNDSDFWVFANREYLQSAESVNSRFNKSLVIKDKGLSYLNNGRLDTNSEGSIEFWISPKFDTYNDPVKRVYFDAAASVTEEIVSTTKATVTISGRASEILSVRLLTDVDNSGVNYFGAGGSLSSDAKTISLKTTLPFQKTPVKVAYVPSGQNGDRITISKKENGYISLSVTASDEVFEVSQPVFWPRNTWHRIRASWKFNRSDNQDEIRLFVDGEERNILLFGSGVLFGQGAIFGQATSGVTNQILTGNMDFTDTIPEFHIGYDYTGSYGAYARMDNIKISNKAIEPLTIGNQPFDFYFNTNPNYIYPSIEDAFTTMLVDFDSVVSKTEDFAILRDPSYGIFNFALTIIDSFDVVVNNARLKAMLEAMINALKPGNSKVDISYIQ